MIQKHTRKILIFISLAIMLIVFAICISQGMHKDTFSSMHAYMAKFIAANISSSLHNLHGFVGYTKIYKILLAHETIDDGIIQAAMAVTNVSDGGIFTMPAVDIGYNTFIKIAFFLFGPKVSSLLFLYFGILIFTASLYISEYRRSNQMLALLVFYMISFYVVGTKAINMELNGGVIYSIRFISLLSILPVFHVVHSVFKGVDLLHNKWAFLRFSLQSSLIVWIHYIRLSTKWTFIAVVLLFILGLAINKFHNFFRRALPVAIFFSIFLVSKVWMSNSIHELYKQKGEGAHVFWHSLYVGLALHPDLRMEFNNERPAQDPTSWVEASGYRPFDQDAYTAALKRLHDTGHSEYELFRFRPEDKINYKVVFTYYKDYFAKESAPGTYVRRIDMEEDYIWPKHESVLKEVVVDVVKQQPLKVLETIFIIKPLKFIRIYINDFHLASGSIRNIIAELVTTIRNWVCLALIALIAFCTKGTKEDELSTGVILVTVFSTSLIVPLVVYPEPWTIVDQASLLTVSLCFGLLCGLRYLFTLNLSFKQEEYDSDSNPVVANSNR